MTDTTRGGAGTGATRTPTTSATGTATTSTEESAMTTTDRGATPGTDLAPIGVHADGTPALYDFGATGAGKGVTLRASTAEATTGGQLRVLDVKGIHAGLTAHARPVERANQTLSPLDSLAVHTGGVTLSAVVASALALSLTGEIALVRGLSMALALGLIALSVLGLVGCARRARTRTQGR